MNNVTSITEPEVCSFMRREPEAIDGRLETSVKTLKTVELVEYKSFLHETVKKTCKERKKYFYLFRECKMLYTFNT